MPWILAWSYEDKHPTPLLCHSGPRIVIDFKVSGYPMGQEIRADDVSAVRRIGGTVIGTATVQSVEIMSNGSVKWTSAGNASREFTFELENTSKMTVPVYHYARIVEAAGE